MRRLALIVAVLPLLAADPAPPTPEEVGAAMLSTLKFDSALTVLDAGAAPRQVVRYHPRAGASVTYDTLTRTKMDLTMTTPDGKAIPMPLGEALPGVVATARNTVGQALPNGLVPVRIEQLGGRIDGPAAPEVARGMTDGLARVKGMRFDILVDPATGRPVQLDVVGGPDPATRDLMQQVADQIIQRVAPFPPDPIGPGAKWKTVYDLSMSGLDLSVTQNCTARTIGADAVDLDMVLEIALGDGALQLPGMPPGMTPEISRFSGGGQGAMRVDLGTLVGSGTSTMNVDLGMKIALPGGPPMTMGMKMNQTTETGPSK